MEALTAALDEAYDRFRSTGPEFGGDAEGNHGLTNHGPMAAEVLVRHGFADRVPEWVDRYVPRLQPMPAATTVLGEWDAVAAIGQPRELGNLAAYFGDQLHEREWQEVLTTWWPRLLPGILGARPTA